MSAERKIQTLDEAAIETEAPLEPFALRQQVAERLAAHRSRRSRDPEPEQPVTSPRTQNSRIAAAVVERYAQSKSYRDFLAEEAERAVREAHQAARQAEAAAEVAARNAEAVAQVQYDLLSELNQYPEASSQVTPAANHVQEQTSHAPRPSVADDSTLGLDFDSQPVSLPAFTVRLAEDLRLSAGDMAAYRAHRAAEQAPEERTQDSANPEEALFLDEEIAFRQAPVFDPVEPPIEIPGNLIQFPRQLVASRRARPRLAEGPLREETESSPLAQLRIFEVEAEQISQEPVSESSAPEWSSILLDAQPRSQAQATYSPDQIRLQASEYSAPAAEPQVAQHLQYSEETQHLYAASLAVAPLGLRLMSAIADTCIVLAAFAVFTAVAALTATWLHPEPLHIAAPTLAISAAGTIALLGFAYQMLFFTFSDSTLGMRYARIGLCTFSDENPSRAAMRRRIFVLALSFASLGLGVLWALLDDERLGWHDRITRMYQRSY